MNGIDKKMNIKIDSNSKKSKTTIFSCFVVILSAVVILAPHGASAMLFLEVLQQYKIQITIIAVLWFLFFLFRKHYICALVQLGLVAWSAYVVMSAYGVQGNVGAGHSQACESEANLRVMTFNSYHMNSDYAAIIDSVTRADPDIVLFQEFKSGLYNIAEKALKPHYPFSYAEIEHGVFQGKALYSKYPSVNIEGVDLRGAFQKVIHAIIDFNGRNIHIVNVHTVSPQSNERIASRNAEMELLSALVNRLKRADEPFIVGGDFNSAPWQKHVRMFKQQTGLNNNGLKNIILTWPAWLPAFLRVPIDQVFYSGEFNKSNYYKGLSAGSDHFPVFVDLVVCK